MKDEVFQKYVIGQRTQVYEVVDEVLEGLLQQKWSPR